MNTYNPQRFWDELDMDRPLFLRWSYMSINFKYVLESITGKNNENHKKLLNEFIRNRKISNSDQKTSFQNFRQKMDKYFFNIYLSSKAKNVPVTDEEMQQLGFDDNEFKMQLGVFSQLLVCAYPSYKVPDRISEIYQNAPKPKGREEMLMDIDALSKFDLADNPGNRAMVLFVIDNSISMDGKAINSLQEAFEDLFEEMKKDNQLLYSVELYIVTCGCGKEEEPTEIVRFATIERQLDLLDNMLLEVWGRCKMGKTINLALDRLEEHIRDMKESKTDVGYYTPWLIILSDGKFKDEMEEVYGRVAKLKERRDLHVYPKALTEKADLAALRRLDEEEAGHIKSVNGFFKDIFNSLHATENQTPGSDNFNIVHKEGFQS